MGAWHHERVALEQRAMVEKGDGVLGRRDDGRLDLARDDAAEETARVRRDRLPDAGHVGVRYSGEAYGRIRSGAASRMWTITLRRK